MSDQKTDISTSGSATTQNKNIQIPKEVREKYPDLIPQIMASKSMDDEERSYWFSVLPIMTDDQVAELRDILATEQKNPKKENPLSEEDLREAEERRQQNQEKRRQQEQVSRASDEEELEDVLAELEL